MAAFLTPWERAWKAYYASSGDEITVKNIEAQIIEAIREAEAAVKERCAKAAEGIAPDWHGGACGCGECVGARSAAEAVRKLP